ncbi:MAG: hypothetical protein Q9M13_09095 [Mariprofundales bacterium]|nr:hypothetical protein [Mariprofundales bacterium]
MRVKPAMTGRVLLATTAPRHAGLDPASIFWLMAETGEAGLRVKPAMTALFRLLLSTSPRHAGLDPASIF